MGAFPHNVNPSLPLVSGGCFLPSPWVRDHLQDAELKSWTLSWAANIREQSGSFGVFTHMFQIRDVD